ncbi:hypothetical protein [Flaviaesturariibacter terrae]
MHPEITDIRRQVPETYSEANLEVLEGLVTRYRDFLAQLADTEFNAEYYTDRLAAIEAALHEARYGNNERQRARGYQHAAASLLEDTEEFSEKYSSPE